MALADFASYKSKIATPSQRWPFVKVTSALRSGRLHSSWTFAPLAGATPSTAAVPTSATAGALIPLQNPGTTLRLAQVEFLTGTTTPPLPPGGDGCVILVDRLSHQGGLSGTAAGAQTTNLPTAALTRYTSGVGVLAGLEIYSSVGGTGTTVTMSYTNQSGTAGQVGAEVAFGGVDFQEAPRFFIMPLVAGDTGVKSVESVTLAGTTGTVGNFGVTLFKVLTVLPMQFGMNQTYCDAIVGLGAQLPDVQSNACLQFLYVARQTVATNISGELRFIEE